MILKSVAIVLFTLCLASCIDPPELPDSFQIAFDQTFHDNGTSYRVNGQLYYDAKNNRERVDRVNGRYSLFCGTILPNVTTPCTHLTVNNKRWIVFSQRKQCCMCCDAAHGCGILRKDWLAGAEYKGQDKLIDTNYDKWSKDGSFGYNYYWTTTDNNHIPRKLDENGAHITDYLTHTFINKTFDDTYFALPSYCNSTCPPTTFCGKLQSAQPTVLEQ